MNWESPLQRNWVLTKCKLPWMASQGLNCYCYLIETVAWKCFIWTNFPLSIKPCNSNLDFNKGKWVWTEIRSYDIVCLEKQRLSWPWWHILNPSTWMAETGGSLEIGQPELHRESLKDSQQGHLESAGQQPALLCLCSLLAQTAECLSLPWLVCRH